jgi:hypothetical protein
MEWMLLSLFPLVKLTCWTVSPADTTIEAPYAVEWRKSVTIPAGETRSILGVLGVDFSSNSLLAQENAFLMLSYASYFYQFQTPSGNRMLAHLSSSQLLNIANWDFLAAGVGGDPHGWVPI